MLHTHTPTTCEARAQHTHALSRMCGHRARAQAIRDGVIDATVDHAGGILVSNEAHDVYSTLEPRAAFHKRITFCLNIHNDAVKAMSYPPDAHKDELPDAEAIKERQREEQELAEALAEEDYE